MQTGYTLHHNRVLWFALVLGGLLVPLVAAAATIEVNSLADPGRGGCNAAQCSLREAIAAAQAEDTVTFVARLFASGPRTLTLTAGTLVIDKALTIAGPGADHLTIQGNQTSPVLSVQAQGGHVTLEGVTLTGGRSSSPFFAGGVTNHAGSTLTLSQSIIRGHTAIIGGGVSNFGRLLTLAHTTISDNVAEEGGGGLHNAVGKLRLISSTVRGNTAFVGGGLSNHAGGVMTFSHSRVDGNEASIGGGLWNEGELWLTNSMLVDNRATSGGGLWNQGALWLSGSTLFGNRAGSGGGLWNQGMLWVSNSTLGINAASIGGAMVNSSFSTLEIQHSTISGNVATTGGGLWNDGEVVYRSSIIAGNTVGEDGRGPDCANFASLTSLGHNLSGARTGCPHSARQRDVIVDPATVALRVLRPLQNNGGPTFTFALPPGSPAIDAGDPETCPARDQRGVSRQQGPGCDIGAFELEVP